MVLARRPGVAFALPPAARGAALAALAIAGLAAADGGFYPSAWRVGAVALGAVAVLLALWTPALPARRALAFVAAPAALAAWSLASALWSVDQSASLLDVQRMLLYTVAAAAFVLAGEGLPAGVVAGSTAVAAWALGERLLLGPTQDPFEGRLLTGPLGYANALGALAAIGGVVAVTLAVQSRGGRRLAAAAPLLVLLPALMLTNSRAAWACGLVGLAVALAAAYGRTRIATVLVACSVLLLAVLLLAPPGGVGDRTMFWQAARDASAAHPIGGTGAGTFATVYTEVRGAGPAARDAHSLYLQTLSELGVVGLALIALFLALPLLGGLRARAAAPLGGFVVFVLHAGVDWDWQMPALTVAALALGAAALHRRPGEA